MKKKALLTVLPLTLLTSLAAAEETGLLAGRFHSGGDHGRRKKGAGTESVQS